MARDKLNEGSDVDTPMVRPERCPDRPTDGGPRVVRPLEGRLQGRQGQRGVGVTSDVVPPDLCVVCIYSSRLSGPDPSSVPSLFLSTSDSRPFNRRLQETRPRIFGIWGPPVYVSFTREWDGGCGCRLY